MTHEKYDELQKKMDKLYSDFIDLAADAEESNEDFSKVSEWVDKEMSKIFRWANTDDKKILADLQADYDKLSEMLEC